MTIHNLIVNILNQTISIFNLQVDSIFSTLFSSYIFATFIRLLSAAVLGAIIGFQREKIHKPAGLKTHILVCVSSALVMLTGEYMTKKYGGLDPTRMAAQVISGLGFLGAGAIIKEGVGVKGLTTAASIWTVSCIGLACGSGYFVGAIMATVLIMAVLLFVKRIEMKYIGTVHSDDTTHHKDEIDADDHN